MPTRLKANRNSNNFRFESIECALSLSLPNQPPRTILEAYQQLDEEICRLEGMCPGPRLATMDTWIQYLETQRTVADKDFVQLPLHLLDDDDNEEEELKYNAQERLNDDIYAITKVRQVCISVIIFIGPYSEPHMSVNDVSHIIFLVVCSWLKN